MGFGPSNFGGGQSQGLGMVGNQPMNQPNYMPPHAGNMPGVGGGWGQTPNGGLGGWHPSQNPAQSYAPPSQSYSPQQPPAPGAAPGMAPVSQPNPAMPSATDAPPSSAMPSQSPSDMPLPGLAPRQFARGGMPQPNADTPQGASPQLGHGLISSPVAGRTDRLPVNAKPDSYVIPADVVSGLGQGNTLAGERIWDAILQPYAAEAAKYPANGSSANQHSVPIIVAGGEIAVDPAFVWAIGHGDTNAGHKTLDRMVVDIRKQVVKQIKNLPGPVK